MGLFDQIASSVLTQLSSNQQSGLMESITGLINNSGGLAGLAETLKQNGLGDAVASWISTGQNQAVTGDQLSNSLGGTIQEIAAKLGMSEGDAANSLANLLPDVIDKLTPNGTVPDNNLLQQGLSMLGGKLFGGQS